MYIYIYTQMINVQRHRMNRICCFSPPRLVLGGTLYPVPAVRGSLSPGGSRFCRCTGGFGGWKKYWSGFGISMGLPPPMSIIFSY